MHLVFTSSYDVTSDMLMDELGSSAIRLNNDRPHDQEVHIAAGGFSVRDGHGREVTEHSLRTAILRKPAPKIATTDDQALHVFREMSAAHSGLLQLIEYLYPEKLPIVPSRLRDVSKFVQLRAAIPFFRIAPWAFSTHPDSSGLHPDVVVKTLSGMPYSPGNTERDALFIYVQPADRRELAEGYPWFLQERVDARFDLTVLYVDGNCYAQRLDRSTFAGLDWRKHIGTETDKKWEDISMPEGMTRKIDAYMKSLRLPFGRLDFLCLDESLDNPLFLEVNTNGQWAWMDLDKNRGIFDAMLRFLTTPRKLDF